MRVGLGAAHCEHQDMESDILCNNIGLPFSAALEFKAIRGGEEVILATIIQTENETTISERRRIS